MFSFPVIRITCDECGEAETDIPVVPAAPAAGVVTVDEGTGGWCITPVRQICPECDRELEGD